MKAKLIKSEITGEIVGISINGLKLFASNCSNPECIERVLIEIKRLIEDDNLKRYGGN